MGYMILALHYLVLGAVAAVRAAIRHLARAEGATVAHAG